MELALAPAVMEREPVFEERTRLPWVTRAVNRGLFSGRLVTTENPDAAIESRV